MILGDVEETITSIEIDDETYEEIVKVHHLLQISLCRAQSQLTLMAVFCRPTGEWFHTCLSEVMASSWSLHLSGHEFVSLVCVSSTKLCST